MKPTTFVQRGERRWKELEGALAALDERGEIQDGERLPGLFRQVSADLSMARHRMYALSLCERINRLVIRAFRHVHRDRSNLGAAMWRGIWVEFPSLVREEARLLWLVMAFFWIPFWGVFWSSGHDLRWTESLLGPEGMESLQEGFGKGGGGFEKVRDNFGSNFHMFAFYILNNVGIDFRTFAGGILGGVGTLFLVVYNALAIGAAAGYVKQEGDMGKFLEWISGHVTPEFLGMLFSAMAGLRLGFALIRPGRLTRRRALTLAGGKAVRLLYGAAGLTLLAAVIEGFWSPLQIALEIKYGFGLALTSLLVIWLVAAGRGEARTVAEGGERAA